MITSGGRKLVKARAGLSLLEVVLAMAIFGGALVMISQLNNIGRLAAARARDMTTAQIYCERTIAELAVGSLTPDPVADAPLPDEEGWLYSIETGAASQPGLIAVQVTVRQDEKLFVRPVNYALVRWIADPGTETAETTEAGEAATSSNSTSAAGGS